MAGYNTEYAKKVYAGLTKRGYTADELGDESLFVRRMADEDNRRYLYDLVQERGNAKMGSWERFNSKMSEAPQGDSAPTFTATELGPDNESYMKPLGEYTDWVVPGISISIFILLVFVQFFSRKFIKGLMIAIFSGLCVYAILSGVRLAEKYVEAKEIEARYIVVGDDKKTVIDLKEKAREYIPLKYEK